MSDKAEYLLYKKWRRLQRKRRAIYTSIINLFNERDVQPLQYDRAELELDVAKIVTALANKDFSERETPGKIRHLVRILRVLQADWYHSMSADVRKIIDNLAGAAKKFHAMENMIPLILRQYDIGSLVEMSYVSAGTKNPSFKIKTTKGNYLFRSYRHGQKFDNINREHNLLAHLTQHEFNAVSPLPATSGKTVVTLEENHYSIFPWKRGVFLRASVSSKSTLAKTIGRYHNLVRGYVPDRHLLEHEKKQEQESRLNCILQIERQFFGSKLINRTGFHNAYNELYAHFIKWQWYGTYTFPDEEIVPIHSDFRAKNLLVRRGRVEAILDFDSIKFAPFVIDVFIGIYDSMVKRTKGDEKFGIDLRNTRMFLKAYHSTSPMKVEPDCLYAYLINHLFLTMLQLSTTTSPIPTKLVARMSRTEYLLRWCIEHEQDILYSFTIACRRRNADIADPAALCGLRQEPF